jgi:hypothetical protein
MAWMRIHIDDSYFTQLEVELLSVLNSDRARRGVNKIIADMCYPYVPVKTGNLRDSVAVGPKEIQWRTEYARYQYYGFVYRPNFFIGYNPDTGEAMFRSPAGKKKYPTSIPLTYHKGGGAFWLETMLAQKSAEMDKRITDYLVDECKRRGL